MIRPLADRVVIEPKAAETQTASGLYIPDTAKEKPQQGTVVAAGPGKNCISFSAGWSGRWNRTSILLSMCIISLLNSSF